MRFALLGSLQVEAADGVVQPLRGQRARTLIALLATRHGEVVTVDEIVDALWPDDGRSASTNALHMQISKLRRALGAPGDELPLRTVHRGYVLEADPDDIDVARFERLVRAGTSMVAEARFAEANAVLDGALALWRGPALAELTAEFAVQERHRLDELRAVAHEQRFEAVLGWGGHELVVAELEQAVATDPLREHTWAQLMLALYRSGRQADALRAYGRARAVLVDEVGVEPGAALRALEARILRQDPELEPRTTVPATTIVGEDPPIRSTPTPHTTNVRHQLSSFIGRTDELTSLTELVAARRVVSIVGPGGVGKTRLASEIAGRRAAAWPDGAWMLELDATSGDGGVARALLTAFGGHPGTANASVDVLSAVDVLAGAVGDAAVLLVLDNCEHVVAAARAAATALLDRCPNMCIVTTSRVVLEIPGEAVCQLQPLAIDDAVALFAARGFDAHLGFAVDEANAGAVRSICQRVDRLPLGIELAAARLRAFAPTQLDAQLADRLGAISSTGDARAPRHRALSATVAWSYDLLFDEERTMLRRLSVFRGSFALDAVEAIATDDELTGLDATDALARLVDRSLVVAERGEREPRYRLLRTVADFAAATADARGETSELRSRHAAWVARLAERANEEVHGPNQARWAARLRDEVPSIDAALAFALDGGDVAIGLQTCADLAWFAMTTTALPTALDDLLALLRRAQDVAPATLARASAWAATLGAGLPEAPELAARAVDLARRLGDDHLLAETLIVTAMPASRGVRSAGAAIAAAAEGRTHAARSGDRWLVAASYAVEGGARALTVAGLAHAVDLLGSAGRGYTELGDQHSAEINAWYLSLAHEDLGDVDGAARVLGPYVVDAETAGSAGAILTTAWMAWLAYRQGDAPLVVACAERLTSVAALHQRRLFWGAARFAIGLAALTSGDLRTAGDALDDALQIHAQIGFDRYVILDHALLGEVAQLAGDDSASIAHHDAALTGAQAIAVPLPHVIALELAATSALRRRDPTEALALQRRATQLRAAHGLAPTDHERASGELLVARALALTGGGPVSRGRSTRSAMPTDRPPTHRRAR